MTALSSFMIERNSFTGVLPDGGIRAMTNAKLVELSHNYFEGTIPTALEANAVFIDHNLLEGTIPQQLFVGRDPAQKW
eukprot:5256804-Amphidinium_carterae.1